MEAKQSKLKLLLSDVFQRNGLLITIFLCAAIVIGGFTLIEAPERSWAVFVLIGVAFLGIFVLINATVVIKVALSLVVLTFTSAFAFQAGVSLEPATAGAFIWLFGCLIVYFGGLTVSYLLPSARSRWSLLSLILFVYFAGVFAIASLGASLVGTAIAGAFTALVLYLALYRFGLKSQVKESLMPAHYKDPELSTRLKNAADNSNLKLSSLVKDEKEAFLLWREQAFVIYPVTLSQAFAVSGGKKSQLTYEGRTINSWLRYLSFVLPPSRKAYGADMLLVLLDVTNANGSTPKVIGVTMPDSKAVVPVGIMPGKHILKGKLAQVDFQELVENFQEFVDDLTVKQKRALNDFAPVELKTKETNV